MTNKEYFLRELIEKREKIQQLSEEISRIEKCFNGMEIAVNNEYGKVIFVDGKLRIAYVQLEDMMTGNVRTVVIPLQELLEIISQ